MKGEDPVPLLQCTWCGHAAHADVACVKTIVRAIGGRTWKFDPKRKTETESVPCPCSRHERLTA